MKGTYDMKTSIAILAAALLVAVSIPALAAPHGGAIGDASTMKPKATIDWGDGQSATKTAPPISDQAAGGVSTKAGVGVDGTATIRDKDKCVKGGHFDPAKPECNTAMGDVSTTR
jgi:hypothetical protein